MRYSSCRSQTQRALCFELTGLLPCNPELSAGTHHRRVQLRGHFVNCLREARTSERVDAGSHEHVGADAQCDVQRRGDLQTDPAPTIAHESASDRAEPRAGGPTRAAKQRRACISGIHRAVRFVGQPSDHAPGSDTQWRHEHAGHAVADFPERRLYRPHAGR